MIIIFKEIIIYMDATLNIITKLLTIHRNFYRTNIIIIMIINDCICEKIQNEK